MIAAGHLAGQRAGDCSRRDGPVPPTAAEESCAKTMDGQDHAAT